MAGSPNNNLGIDTNDHHLYSAQVSVISGLHSIKDDVLKQNYYQHR
jgi:hypothetical protein